MLAWIWRNGNTGALFVGMYTGAATVENTANFPQKLKTKLLYDPAILLLSIYLKEMKILS